MRLLCLLVLMQKMEQTDKLQWVKGTAETAKLFELHIAIRLELICLPTLPVSLSNDTDCGCTFCSVLLRVSLIKVTRRERAFTALHLRHHPQSEHFPHTQTFSAICFAFFHLPEFVLPTIEPLFFTAYVHSANCLLMPFSCQPNQINEQATVRVAACLWAVVWSWAMSLTLLNIKRSLVLLFSSLLLLFLSLAQAHCQLVMRRAFDDARCD